MSRHPILANLTVRWGVEKRCEGAPYDPLRGKELWLPPSVEERPRSEFLEWHADTVFRG